MSLYNPYFQIQPRSDTSGSIIVHNCDGGVGFRCQEEVSEPVARLLELAIEEGKRRKAEEIKQCLGFKNV